MSDVPVVERSRHWGGIALGCAALAVTICVVGVVAAFQHFRERRLESSLTLELPSCRDGRYTPTARNRTQASPTSSPLDPKYFNPRTGEPLRANEDPSTGLPKTGFQSPAGGAEKPPTDVSEIVSDFVEGIQSEMCEQSKGLAGSVIFTSSVLNIELHNSSVYPITSVRIRIDFMSRRQGTTVSREYLFKGAVPAFADGSMSARTNLEARDFSSIRGAVVMVGFDKQ